MKRTPKDDHTQGDGRGGRRRRETGKVRVDDIVEDTLGEDWRGGVSGALKRRTDGTVALHGSDTQTERVGLPS